MPVTNPSVEFILRLCIQILSPMSKQGRQMITNAKVPAAATGLPEQCDSVDLPKSDQTFVFDTPLIHQVSGCENSQNLYSPNDTARALTNCEEIITPTTTSKVEKEIQMGL
ncbi:uncharacterized protein LOC115988274 [Quercus lobata]|uniref:uncharacterized protein LOC115988274 n=1 Tax=Quercus lobata TaxID=97700 RepID=UPI00124562B5|nr:uncharacterized protein LOC115988274 [Quercus lobata]